MKGIDIFTGKCVKLVLDENIIIDKQEINFDASLPFISPGFVDMQVNGYRGIDYSSPDLSYESILSLIKSLAKSGTTQHIPTIITSSQEHICKNLKIIASCVNQNEMIRRSILGIHVEGPYISEIDGPRGAHDLSFVRDPSISELDEWIDSSNNLIRLITLAPERDGSMAYIKEATKRGITISLGHTQATSDIIQKAIGNGAACSTHLGNGAHAILPKLNNYIYDQLSSPSLYCGVIADGFHIPRNALDVFYKAKGNENFILVSDVAFLGGMKSGKYKWGAIDVEVFDDGHIGLVGTPYLAGAGHLLDTCIAHMIEVVKAPLHEIIKCVTENPIKALKLKIDKKLEIGSPSDITCFYLPRNGAPLDIVSTYLQGKPIYEKILKEHA